MTTAPRRFDGLIGTGGIGSGRFFALDGDHTLGREESRSGRFLDRCDYCKLHIVAHYVQTLLAPRLTTARGEPLDHEARGEPLDHEARGEPLDHEVAKPTKTAKREAHEARAASEYAQDGGGEVRELRASWPSSASRLRGPKARRALRGPDTAFLTVAIGRVGDDEAGATLLREMAVAGIDTRYVTVGAGEQTLYALCFLYPDGSGGNLTVNDSASGRVDAAAVRAAADEFARLGRHGIALALPEVPLPARQELLALATEHGLFRAASFTTTELVAQVSAPTELARLAAPLWLTDIDLLALNLDEAAALAAMPADAEPEGIVRAAAAALRPGAWLTVTAGGRGSWSWDGTALAHQPALATRVVGTAGAGDAHLAGVLTGLALGLPLADAHQLGALTAAVAVASPHTINFDLDRAALLAAAGEAGLALPPVTRAFLEGAA